MSSKKRNVETSAETQDTSGTAQQGASEGTVVEEGTQTAPATTVTVTRKVRERDPRLNDRDAIVAAWKAQGNKGVPDSIKVQDFKRVAQRRLDECLEALRRLGHCGNRSNYAYTEEQAAKLMASLTNALSEVEQAFEPKGVSAHRVEL